MRGNRPSVKIQIGLTVIVPVVLAMACHNDQGNNATVPHGQKPVITSMGSDASELIASQYTSVYCDAYDPDGDSLTYFWSADNGAFAGGNQKAAVRWVAPSNPCMAILTCTVSDGGLSTSMDLGIIVKPKP
jgi:hypothetical protein